MEYPMLNVPSASRQMLDTFKGYNHNLRIGEGEFYEMQNLTSDHYPLLSSRKKRGIFTVPEKCTGMIAKDALCYVDGSQIVINGYGVEMGLSDSEKQLISMGAYIIILPDKKYINTANLDDRGSMENSVTTKANVVFSLCKQDGTPYNPQYTQASEPADPKNMEIWLDTSSNPVSLKQWSASSAMWASVVSTYIRVECPGLGAGFSQYDGVTITGLKDTELLDENGEVFHSAELDALDGSFAVWQQGEDYLVITGILSRTMTVTNSITVSRKLPQMDFVVECKNRLWGCYYGLSEDGTQVINEIYCSKLGDFKNWSCYMGISTDSWTASVGTDGKFTGAISYLGHPLFFKENALHQVYISEIGAHTIVDTACRGVQEGSHKSLAIVGEILYYKSARCVCAYGGSLPSDVSQALGGVFYHSAVAGVDASKYYICMKDSADTPHVFVLDTDKGMWHREDSTDIRSFCSCRGDLYFLDGGDQAIKTISGAGEPEPGRVAWYAQTGPIGLSLPDMKAISRFALRMTLPVGSILNCYAQYDSSGIWEHLFTLIGTGTRSFLLPVRPVRCDHLQLRLEGVGDFKLYSITKTIEQGSDVS